MRDKTSKQHAAAKAAPALAALAVLVEFGGFNDLPDGSVKPGARSRGERLAGAAIR